MYINRRGLVDNPGFRGIVKAMSFDMQSLLLMMANDMQGVSKDLIEELKETRMRLMIFSMKMKGLLPPFQTPPERFARLVRFSVLPGLQRASAAVSSAMALLLFFHK